MGQQQLLLLVLATVIVGLATVAGIQAFEQGSVRANQDALTQTAVKIASDAQANLKEPEPFGGAGASSTSGIESGEEPSLSELGYDTITKSSSTHFGTEAYDTADGECAITGTKNSGTPYVTVECESTDASVTVQVQGFTSSDIKTTDQTIK